MLHDPVALENWSKLIEYFPDYQLSLIGGEDILAVINTVPLAFDRSFEHLPDRGVDWGVEESVSNHENNVQPNVLMGVQVVVNKAHRNKGLSEAASAEMIKLAARCGLEHLILPVRPSHKHRFPLIPITRYIDWKTADGLPYDGWLRVHARAGGRTVRICPTSMRIGGTVDEWARWTGLDFPGSGQYVVPGALVPVDIDVERGQGLYEEPNVWVTYDIEPNVSSARP